MQAGEIRGPVKTEFGWHVIQVREIKGAPEGTVRQVRDAPRDRAGRGRSRARLQRPHQPSWSTCVYKNPTALGSGRARPRACRCRRSARSRAAAAPASPRNPRGAARRVLRVADPGRPVSDPIEVAPEPHRPDARHRSTRRRARCRWRRCATRSSPRSAPSARRRPRRRRRRAGRAAQGRRDARRRRRRARPGAARRCRACRAARRCRIAAASEAYFSVPAPAAGKVSPGKRAPGRRQHVVFAVDKVTPGDPAKATPEATRDAAAQLAQSGGADDARAFVATLRKQMKVQVAEDAACNRVSARCNEKARHRRAFSCTSAISSTSLDARSCPRML